MPLKKMYLSKRPRQRAKIKKIIIAVVLFTLIYTCWTLLRPLPSPIITPVLAATTLKAELPSDFTFPDDTADSALLALDSNQTFATATADKKLSTASTIKLLTALVVIDQVTNDQVDKKTITLTNDDVALYEKTIAEGGSNIKVLSGETLSIREALTAMLLPSANNMAFSLAKNISGSPEKFIAAMNKKAKDLGMKNTVITDPSGLDPGTISTARDMLILLKEVAKNPILTSVIGTKQASFPGAGLVTNTANSTIGRSGIIGGKTGTTADAGGCFAFIATVSGGKKIVGIVMNAGYTSQTAQNLAALTMDNFATFVEQAPKVTVPILLKDTPVAEVSAPWLKYPQKILSKDAKTETKNAYDDTTVSLEQFTATTRNWTASLSFTVKATNLAEGSHTFKLQQPISKPSALWRLTHPF